MTNHERLIREIAYDLWEQEGRPEGHSERLWLAAEARFEAEIAELRDERSEPPAEPAVETGMLIQAGRSWRPRPPNATPTAVELRGCLLRERLAPEVVGQSALRDPPALVPDLARAIAFYAEAFGLTVTRRLGAGAAELSGLPVRLSLLEKSEGTIGAGKDLRRYDRHWTPVHVDVIVDDVEAALTRAVAVGARVESGVRVEAYGKIAILSDPFGHGFCLIQFLGRGYDEIADIDAQEPRGDGMPSLENGDAPSSIFHPSLSRASAHTEKPLVRRPQPSSSALRLVPSNAS